jgi:hypothetical protein
VGRALVATSRPIPAKAEQPNEPPHKPRDRHSYMARPPRRAKQPILIAVVGNELRSGFWRRGLDMVTVRRGANELELSLLGSYGQEEGRETLALVVQVGRKPIRTDAVRCASASESVMVRVPV